MRTLFAQGEHIFVVVEYVFAHTEYDKRIQKRKAGCEKI